MLPFLGTAFFSKKEWTVNTMNILHIINYEIL